MNDDASMWRVRSRDPQVDRDAARARELVEAVVGDGDPDLYRRHGPDRLLAAAQVYATLATRRS